MEAWYLYVIRCGDGSLYTGITTDVERRFAEHASGGPKAAKYVRGRGPVELELQVEVGDRPLASRLEYRVKGLTKAEKEKLLLHPEEMHVLLAAL
jgi:putative endonuclease